MKYYLAPLEGITGYIYRNTYEKYFQKIVLYSVINIIYDYYKKDLLD